jgi:hypothetical protein
VTGQRIHKDPFVFVVDVEDGQTGETAAGQTKRVRIGKLFHELFARYASHLHVVADGRSLLLTCDLHRKGRDPVGTPRAAFSGCHLPKIPTSAMSLLLREAVGDECLYLHSGHLCFFKRFAGLKSSGGFTRSPSPSASNR